MNIISRDQWGAQPPRSTPIRMKLPARQCWLHHTVTQVSTDRMADVRLVQRIAFSRKFSDVSYSFLVDVDGNVYEGRGFNVGAHTSGLNSTSFGVALIGNYEQRVVTDAQVAAVRQLVAWLRAEGALGAGVFPTGGHRQAPGASTACPGEWAMKRLAEMRIPWFGIPAPKEVAPMFDPPIQIAAWCRVTYGGGGEVAVTPDGHVYCDPPDLYRGAPAGQPYWGNRRAARIEPFEDRYRIVATTGEPYADF